MLLAFFYWMFNMISPATLKLLKILQYAQEDPRYYRIGTTLYFINKETVGDIDCNRDEVTHLQNLQVLHGHLRLDSSGIKDLGELQKVTGHLDLDNTQIESLGELEWVSTNLFLKNIKIKTLGKLRHVGVSLFLAGSTVSDLGELEHVSIILDVRDTPLTNLGKLNFVEAVILAPNQKKLLQLVKARQEKTGYFEPIVQKD